MPRNVTTIIPDPSSTTEGIVMHVRRRGARLFIELDVPSEPDGTFEMLASRLTAPQQTALNTVFTAVAALLRADRGYT